MHKNLKLNINQRTLFSPSSFFGIETSLECSCCITNKLVRELKMLKSILLITNANRTRM